ncbi:hypothetical protein ANANG_G00273320 [Anguilla anguilla]|uniref:Uncharacterized protein n=1 Tax=Anguilla anguilla TaxID=7936 RepID=A0A9D3LMX4_ANGAN|nr:hypothetical protein ANANG_G00273320 [Anguilla anguilla]
MYNFQKSRSWRQDKTYLRTKRSGAKDGAVLQKQIRVAGWDGSEGRAARVKGEGNSGSAGSRLGPCERGDAMNQLAL